MKTQRKQFVVTAVMAALVLAFLVAPIMAVAAPIDITRVDKTITPDTVASGQEATVTLTFDGDACDVGTVGADVALVMDRSWSMYLSCDAPGCPNPTEDRIGPAVEAAKGFIQRMDFSRDQGAVIAFAKYGDILAPLGSSQAQLEAQLDWLINNPADTEANGGTAIGNGIYAAHQELISGRHKPGNAAAMIVLSDGEENQYSDPIGRANAACNDGIQVFTIGLGSSVDSSMQSIPCNGGFYSYAPTPADLDAIYQSIADTVLGPLGTNAVVTDTVPSGLAVVPGSISHGGVLSGDVITWQLTQVKKGTVLSYRVSATEPGTYVVGPGAITYDDCAGVSQTMDFPDRMLTVTNAPPPSEIPEPTTILLLGSGLAGLAGYVRRKRNHA